MLLNRLRIAAPLLALASLAGCATGYHGLCRQDAGPSDTVRNIR